MVTYSGLIRHIDESRYPRYTDTGRSMRLIGATKPVLPVSMVCGTLKDLRSTCYLSLDKFPEEALCNLTLKGIFRDDPFCMCGVDFSHDPLDSFLHTHARMCIHTHNDWNSLFRENSKTSLFAQCLSGRPQTLGSVIPQLCFNMLESAKHWVFQTSNFIGTQLTVASS